MKTKNIESEKEVRGRRISFLGYCFTPDNVRLRKNMKKTFARKDKRIKSRKRKQQIRASYWGWCKWGDCRNLWKTITDNDIIWEEQPIQVSADTTPIGTIKQQLWNSAPPGYLKMTQSHVLNRSEYPELWDFVQKYYPLTSEVEWQKMLTLNNTSVGYVSTGDDSTTFRTPFILVVVEKMLVLSLKIRISSITIRLI